MGTAVEDQQLGCLWQGPHLLSVSLSGYINYLDVNNPATPLRVVKVSTVSLPPLYHPLLSLARVKLRISTHWPMPLTRCMLAAWTAGSVSSNHNPLCVCVCVCVCDSLTPGQVTGGWSQVRWT